MSFMISVHLSFGIHTGTLVGDAVTCPLARASRMNPDRSQMSPFPNIQENRTYSEQNSYYGHSILRRPQEESGGLSLYSKTKQNS